MKKIFNYDNFIKYFYFYIFILPWNFFNAQMGISTIILFVWWLYLNKEYKFYKKLFHYLTFKPLLFFILFILWSYLSLLWTDNFSWAKISLKYYKYYWFLIPIVLTSFDKKIAINSIYIFTLSLGIYSLFSIGIYLDIIYIKNSSHYDPKGILAYAIVTPYMAISFFFSFFIFLYEKNYFKKYLYLFFSLTSLFALFINNGRAGQLAFFITLIVLFIIFHRKYLNLKISLGILLIVIISLFLLNDTKKIDRFKEGFYELTLLKKRKFKGNFGSRAYMWYAAFNLIPKHPFMGAGAGDHIDEFIEFAKIHPSEANCLRSFHNQHLDIIMKYGFIGYFLFIISILYFLHLLYNSNEEFLFLISLSFFSITLFDGVGDIILLMKPYNNVYMLMFLLFIVIFKINKNESKI